MSTAYAAAMVSVALACSIATSLAFGKCPDASLDESAIDCPWADLARESTVPTSLLMQIKLDKAQSGLFSLWSRSVNFDDHAQATIVSPDIMKTLGAAAGLDLSSKETHAGIIHSYGYMLSVLQTPYGYKRARWVLPTIETGFGLPKKTISPAPRKGTLLQNSTSLFGRIAFQGDAQRLSDLNKATPRAEPAIAAIPLKDLDWRRLVETVQVLDLDGKARTVELRTDVIAFPKTSRNRKTTLTHLLVYSVVDGAKPAQLITGFPIDHTFASSLFAPKTLGEGKSVNARFNAHIPGISGADVKGTRTVVLPAKSADEKPIVLNDNDWPPFFFGGRDGGPHGAAKDMLEMCLPATGRRTVFRNFPIKRMRRDIESGDLDVNIYSYEKTRDSYVFFGTEPIFRSSYQPVVRADSTITINRISDFDALKLGHQEGLSYSPAFKAYVEGRAKAGTLDTSDSEESNFKKLLAGRFDIYVSSTPTVLWLAKEQGLREHIKVLDFAIKRADYFITFSKTSKHLSTAQKKAFLGAVDDCVKQLKQDGTHANILESYGLAPLN